MRKPFHKSKKPIFFYKKNEERKPQGSKWEKTPKREIVVYGRHPVLLSLPSRKITKKHLYIAENLRDQELVRELEGLAKKEHIPCNRVTAGYLDSKFHLQGEPIQGCLLTGEEFLYDDVQDALALADQRKQSLLLVILDHIHDPHNVGAIIRTAEALGAHGIILPKHDACPVNGTVIKTSAGTVNLLPIIQVMSIGKAVLDLKKQGIQVFALDFPASKKTYDVDFHSATAVVVGNEGKGIGPTLREKCTAVVKIPHLGSNQSLNVSVATAMVLYEAMRQRIFIR